MNRHQGWLPVVLLLIAAGCSHSPPAPVEESAVTGKRHANLDGETPVDVPEERKHRGSATQHVVEKGDTLYSIAFRYGVDFRVLAAVNGIREPFTIYPGQQLMIKAGGVPVTPKPKGSKPEPAKLVVEKPVVAKPAETKPVDAKPVASNADARKPTPANPAPGIVETIRNKPEVVPVAPVVAAPSPKPAVSPTPPAPTRFVGGGSWQWPVRGKVLAGFNANAVGPKGIAVSGNAGDAVRAARDGRVVYTGDNLVGYGQLIIVKHNDEYLSAYAHNRKLLVKEGDVVKAGDVIAEMGSTGADRTKLHFEVRRNGDPIDPMSVLPPL